MSNVEVRVIDNAGLLIGGWGFNTDQSWATMGGMASYIPLGNDNLAAGQAVTWPGVLVPPWALPAVAPPLASLACNFGQVVTINLLNGPVAGSALILGGPAGPLTGPNYLIAGALNNAGLGNAQAIEFYENGIRQSSINVPLNGPQGISNYWNNISLVPEPGTWVMLVCGALASLICVGWRRLRR
jgi:hypothetical protein